MHNILYIVTKNLDNKEEEALKQILPKFIGIKESMFKVVDTSSTDFTVNGKSMFLCFDGLFGTYGRELVSTRGYKPTDLIRGNIADDTNKLLLFGLGGRVSDYAMPHSSKEDKLTLLNIMNAIKAKMDVYYPILMGVKEVEPIEELAADPLEKEFDSAKQQSEESSSDAAVQTPVVQPIAEMPAQVSTDGEVVSLSVNKLIDDVVENLKLSDPGIGKSLKLTKMITLQSSDGSVINIYPGNVVDSKLGGAHISFKDMCCTIKMALLAGAEKINFHLRKE